MNIDINKLSPMMTHYLQVKEKHPDCIVFYRLGDFYEMFFDDAIKASEILELTLTGRNCGLEERAPMCGVPFHSADIYISKLVAHGEKVAICEQLSEAGGKDLVRRDVIRVVTAGTINDDSIDEKSNNFLGCVYSFKNEFAYSWVDITTGEFFAKSFKGENASLELFDTLLKTAPVEIIANSVVCDDFNLTPYVKQGLLPKFSKFSDSEFIYEIASENLLNQLNVRTLNSFNIKDYDIVINSSGALIAYLKQTQKHALLNINKIVLESKNDYMMLDANTVRNLEIIRTIRDNKKYGSLLWLLDKTKTSMGARKLQQWILSPLNTVDKIEYRQMGVEAFFNNTLMRENLRDILSGFKDIGRVSGKIAENTIKPRECITLARSLALLPSIKMQLFGIQAKIVQNIDDNLKDFSNIVKLLESAINDVIDDETSFIKPGYDAELDELRLLSKSSKIIIGEIEKREKERTGIKNLRINYNRVFGYYIEVTNSFKSKVPYEYERKQTLANAERYVTQELKELEVKILSSEEKAKQLEIRLFNDIKEILAREVSFMQKTADAVAELDVLLSLATVARERNYTRPLMLDYGKPLNLVESRHPVVEAIIKGRFIENDCLLDSNENRTMIITGPNMAGKSTFMRQTALITIMAHLGSFVPCKVAEIPLTDRIFTRIGASDSLISDQSTFMVEMSETAFILKNATKNSLIILDEIGRGTSTFDGLSIAWSVVEYITKNIGAKTLFATHYHELTELEEVFEGVKNYKVTVKEIQGTIIFLRKIMRGSANKSFGIEVAELAGVTKNVTTRAKEILKMLENSDITKKPKKEGEIEKDKPVLSESERIIRDLDINNISPMQAFSVLSDLKDKVMGKIDE